MSIQPQFGAKVRLFREKRGWTQTALAEALKWHQPDVCDLEKGRHEPTLDTVKKVAEALGTPWKKLVD